MVDVLLTIGPIIDETQNHSLVNNNKCSNARQFLLVKWLILGFCLTASYKSVLLSNMVNNGYEKAIDSVEDMLQSAKPLLVPRNSYLPSIIRKSSRENVRKLAKQFKFFDFDAGNDFGWIGKGLVQCMTFQCTYTVTIV